MYFGYRLNFFTLIWPEQFCLQHARMLQVNLKLFCMHAEIHQVHSQTSFWLLKPATLVTYKKGMSHCETSSDSKTTFSTNIWKRFGESSGKHTNYKLCALRKSKKEPAISFYFANLEEILHRAHLRGNPIYTAWFFKFRGKYFSQFIWRKSGVK